MTLVIVVFGDPAPQGSKRFVGTNKAGRGILIESSKRVRPWRQDVVARAMEAREGHDADGNRTLKPTLDGPLRVRMVFTVRKPTSAPKKKRTLPCTKPDLSKLVRSTEDALVTSGAIRDDARIQEYARVAKVYPGEDPEALDAPGVRIIIEQIAA